MRIKAEELPVLLREFRERKGLSMEEFGQLYGVTKQAVSLWESGDSRPRPELLRRIGVIYMIEVD